MSEQFVGEIRPVGFSFAPPGWLSCDGSIVAISDYDTLFALIGTTYGGDGVDTFGLPDLRGRMPVHQGSGYVLGQSAGSENVTLVSTQLPSHTHPIAAQSATGGQSSPANGFFAASTQNQFGTPGGGGTTAPILTNQGGNLPHSNIQPYQCINYIIAVYGIYPSQN